MNFVKILREKLDRTAFTICAALIFAGACSDFFNIAWGTGDWVGEFSRTWIFLYALFVIITLAFVVITYLCVWKSKLVELLLRKLIDVRNSLGGFRWLLWALILFAPVWFFQYTPWGVVFQKLYIRLFIWLVMVCLLTIISSKGQILAGWNQLLASLVISASVFSIFASLTNVNGYPFSLGWSEGNRIWDYSMLFGRDLYTFSENKKTFVLLDFGRQLIGGLPFLIPGMTLFGERLWIGLMLIFPYIILGIAIFRGFASNKVYWLMAVLFVFLFLKQGPIHAPLVLSAALVALAWGSPLWLGVPLVMGAGYFAVVSRFSWVFAPGMWIVMLEFASSSFSDRISSATTWKRSSLLGISGIFGGILLPRILGILPGFLQYIQNLALGRDTSTDIAGQFLNTGINTDTVVQGVTSQPLLWYRLLPNSTYGNGILFALLLAVGPLLLVLYYLVSQNIWKLNFLQRISIVLPLLAFMGVGLVASTKIGGGGDLHNMDMFLIGVLFTAAIAWHRGGWEWLSQLDMGTSSLRILIVFIIAYTSLYPLMEMRTFAFAEELSWIKTLTDSPTDQYLGMLPTQNDTNEMIQIIQGEVDQAKQRGEVLFIDQRQLLTFGYIKDVALVPDYEKKILMTVALSGDAELFKKFYADLASKRFSLIVSEPLRTPVQDISYQFGEENNAWTSWVATPILCYYVPLITKKDFRVELLYPKPGVQDCSQVIPPK